MRLMSIIFNALPYYLTKKIILKYTGDGCYLRMRHSTNEISGICFEFDLGEFAFFADEATYLKKKASLESALRKTEERLESLKNDRR